ncbi:MAG TPA: FAD-dependent oxidoreductase [Stellaceae bacterium]|nr:FAD-dependent oxidoreductase [Stellaceae bacterium]
MTKVIVLGGGIGGLTAAHELVARGFEPHIYDTRNIPGGKSRTLPVPDSGTDGRRDLPGEHGFRFFPAFYVHLPDSMKRIPYGRGQSCFDNLVPTHHLELAQYDAAGIKGLTGLPESLDDVLLILKDLFGRGVGVPLDEIFFFAQRIWQVMTSCDERRLTELEAQSWWDYVDAPNKSAGYQKFLANGLSRSLVAAVPQEASARTIGQIQVRLIAGVATLSTDRVLNGPTSTVFLEPWIAELKRLGARYHELSHVTRINMQRGAIKSVAVRRRGATEVTEVDGDWFVSALPVECLAPLLSDDLLRADPGLRSILELQRNVRWMNGIQFFLKQDAPIIDGHVLYVDSPWAITSISEAQFWGGFPLSGYGDGTVKGVLSVDISDWNEAGTFVPKPACEASREEIAQEVWQELKRSLNVGGKQLLHDDMLHSYFLDSDIEIAPPGQPRPDINLEPLFINRPNTWTLRPPATSAIPNFVLAADFVQTNTDLACMEAANEAARRAVNAVLDATGSAAPRCRLWPMEMPPLLAHCRALDSKRFARGLPWNGHCFL